MILMKKIGKLIIISLISLVFAQSLPAQVNTVYYLRDNPYRHQLNPAFQPTDNIYIDFPIFPTVQLNFGNNDLTFRDFVYPKMIDGTMQTITFLHPEANKDDFYNRLKPHTNIRTSVQVELLSFGFRTKKSYITFDVSQKTIVIASLPKDMFKLMLYGTPDTLNINSFDFSSINISSSEYTEYAMGYSRKINDKLSIGIKGKLLYGQANVSTNIETLKLNASRDSWDATIVGTINGTLPKTEYKLDEKGKITSIQTNFPKSDSKSANKVNDLLSNYIGMIFKPSGSGFAVDLGATYKVSDKLTVSASILDMGSIVWRKNTVNIPVSDNFKVEGFNFNQNDSTGYWDQYGKVISDSIKFKTSFNPYRTPLPTKIFIGGEYFIYKNKISIGLLSNSTFFGKRMYEEITTSVNFLPTEGFNASLSYSLLNGKFNSLGVGMNFRTDPWNVFIASDYVPLKYTTDAVPYNSRFMNLKFGICMTFGNYEKTKTEKQEKTNDKSNNIGNSTNILPTIKPVLNQKK